MSFLRGYLISVYVCLITNDKSLKSNEKEIGFGIQKLVVSMAYLISSISSFWC